MRGLILAAVMAVGGWQAVNGGINLGSASAPPFNYDTASVPEREAWLTSQIQPIRKSLRWSLPSGGAPTQPSFSVGDVRANTRRRAIEIDIKVKGRYQFNRSQIPAVKQQLVKQLCPKYAESEAGRNGVQLIHSFIGKKGRRELQLFVSPTVCRAYM